MMKMPVPTDSVLSDKFHMSSSIPSAQEHIQNHTYRPSKYSRPHYLIQGNRLISEFELIQKARCSLTFHTEKMEFTLL